MKIQIVLLCFAIFQFCDADSDWSYVGPNGPDHWCELDIEGNSCCGTRQSPIDIYVDNLEFSRIEVELKGFDYQWSSVNLLNEKHTVKVFFPNSADLGIPSMVIWPDPDTQSDTYSFRNIHFHFGSSNDAGSEHHINSKAFAMEMHSVFYNTKYSDADCLKNPDGVVVLGTLFEISPYDNLYFIRLTNALSNVSYVGQSFNLEPGLSLNDLFPDDKTTAYYYEGSLTTPACNEVASWFVFKDTVPISQNQLDKFRQLTILTQDEAENGIPPEDVFYMSDNIRPTQYMLGREVKKRHFEDVHFFFNCDKQKLIVFKVYYLHDIEPVNPVETGKYGSGSSDWSFKGPSGPEHWGELPLEGNQCGGTRQSPINIDLNSLVSSPIELETIGFDHEWTSVAIFNDKHTAKLFIPIPSITYIPTVVMRPCPGVKSDTYSFKNLHFHFGSCNDVGSEHQINCQKSPMEMHVVFFNTKYCEEDVPKKPDGIIALGWLFEISECDNPGYSPLTNALCNIVYVGQLFNIIPGFSINDLLPASKTTAYSYEGSFTTPICIEAVTWFVFKDKVPISQNQLDQFRTLSTFKKIDIDNHISTGDMMHVADNFRPLQPLNGRKVKKVQVKWC
ncbi:Carbonic AnHydrase [Chamberlinius hualienensis]